MELGQPGEQSAQGRQVEPGPVDPSGEQRGEGVPLGGDPLRLGQRLPHQPATPEREPAGDPVVPADLGADPVDHELGAAGVAEAVQHDGAGVDVEERRDLGVEVGGEPVPDVRRDQPLEPVRRGGPGVEGVERLGERRHRRHRVRSEPPEVVPEPLEVRVLDRRHLRQLGLVLQPGSHAGVLGEPVERRDLAVRHRSEELHDGRRVGGVLEGQGGR